MRLSRERLQREAKATGFRVEILEKVARLLDLLDGFDRHPYLKERLVLKGGTALNLFVFDVPRLHAGGEVAMHEEGLRDDAIGSMAEPFP